MPPMGQWTDQRALTRCAIVCIVLGVHGLFVLLFWQVRQSTLRRADDNYLTWVRLEPSRRPPAPPPPSPPAPRTAAREPAAAAPQAVTRATPAERSDTAPRQIDWAAAAAREASRAARAGDDSGYRSFGPRKPGASPEAAPPTIFEAPKHQLGDEGVDPFGDPIVWLTEHCYKELPRLITTARDLPVQRPLSAFKCVWPAGRREPRGDLFESLKRDRPLPEPKAGSVSELPERAPQTPRPGQTAAP